MVDGWWVETQTIGCAHEGWFGDDNAAWESHYDMLAAYAADGISVVFGSPEDGYLVTITPQRCC